MSNKTYDEYKTIDNMFFNKIPINWSIFKLKHIINSLESGKRKDFEDTNFAFSIGGEHINWNGTLNLTNKRYITEEFYNSLSKGKINKNDILLVKDGATIGKTAFISDLSQKMAVNEHVFIIRNNERLIPKLLYYLITSHLGFTQIKLTETGSAQGGISQDIRDKVDFIIPNDLKEQQQIANYLDKQTAKIDATIAKNEELIQLLEEKRVALINQVITKGLNPDVPMKDSGVEWIGEIPEHWDVDCLKHNVILNAKTLTDTTDNDYEFDYVDIGSVSLENGIEKYEHMSFEDAPSRARRVVKKDDVIISTVRTYLKAIAIIPDKEDIIVSTGFAVLTPNKIDSRYLGYMVKTEYFTNLVSAHSVGVSYPAINSTDLVNLDILIPPNNEQKQIADYLDNEVSNINDIITKVTENINLLEEYKTSLIHHVVTGKIDVRGEEI